MAQTAVGLCGSLRQGSYNRKLLAVAAAEWGAGYAEASLRLPLYDGDLESEQGIPPGVQALAEAIRAADAVIIAAPEYNKSLTGVLKNALDWSSRVKGGVWRDKPVAIVSAAGGREGGARAQFALRLALVPLRARVLPGPEVCVAQCDTQFNPDGSLISETYRKTLADLIAALRAA